MPQAGHRERGATMIEYVLIVSGVALVLAFIAAGLVEPLDSKVKILSTSIGQA